MRREFRWIVVGGVFTALCLERMQTADLPPDVESRGYEEPSTLSSAANSTATPNVRAYVSDLNLSEMPVRAILKETSLRPIKIYPQFPSKRK